MNLYSAEREAKMLMAAHGLTGWTFKYDNAKRRSGRCTYGTKTISISRPLTELRSPETVRNTVLHEIAHALVGPSVGHGPEWVRMAKSIGCNGQRCSASTPETIVPPNWKAVCPEGHVAAKRLRRPKVTARPKSCGRCSPSFNPRFLLRWVPANA